jgi:hydrogenase maturation protease
MQDEGLGVAALHRIEERYRLPAEVQVIDGGVMGLDLLPYLTPQTHMLMIDCLQTGAPPGTIVRLDGADIITKMQPKMSMHQVGLQEMLALASFQGSLPERVVVWGMVPQTFVARVGLSPLVEERLDALVDAVILELREWGVPVI